MILFTKEYLPTSVLCFLVLIFQLWSPLLILLILYAFTYLTISAWFISKSISSLVLIFQIYFFLSVIIAKHGQNWCRRNVSKYLPDCTESHPLHTVQSHKSTWHLAVGEVEANLALPVRAFKAYRRVQIWENCTILGYYAESSGNLLPTFRHNL